jgi:uncharacterized protein (TIGR00730 family)
MTALCVYCGASSGTSPRYAEQARAMGAALAARGIRLVYGGGNVGLMGAVADEILQRGGEAAGVIPQALMQKELGHGGLTELHIVADMHERKAMMAELSDGFIALPGGLGTLEELFEMLTWSQLGFHAKPVGILNVDGYYDDLLRFLRHSASQGFLRSDHEALLMVENDPDTLLDRFAGFPR